jgi:SAM-dependent methyltransferase
LSIEDPEFIAWLEALEARHLADLRVQEVTRALRALSAAYVVRRTSAALDGAGKRAAFALFYAPLHFLVIRLVVQHLRAEAPRTIVDLGCGTGAAGSAWAIETGRDARVIGIDRHPWAVDEARWTYRQLKVNGRARQGDVDKAPAASPATAFVAAYVLNELQPALRERVLASLTAAVNHGASVLIVEPISRSVTPWWTDATSALEKFGGRADEWRFAVDLPPLLAKFDKAAGLDHRELTARTLYCPGLRLSNVARQLSVT